MKSRSGLFMLSVVVVMLLLAACGAAPAATQAPADVGYVEELPATEAPALQAPAYDEAVEKQAEGIPQEQAPAEALLAPMPTAAAYEISNPSGELTVVERSNRMIIKNADIRLMVQDTDLAIDRATQVIADTVLNDGI